MFNRLKFKIINRVNLRVDVYIKNVDNLIPINDYLHKKFLFSGAKVLLIEYFDDKRAAKGYFKAIADNKVDDRELDRMEEHYIAEMNRNTADLRLHNNNELLKKYYL